MQEFVHSGSWDRTITQPVYKLGHVNDNLSFDVDIMARTPEPDMLSITSEYILMLGSDDNPPVRMILLAVLLQPDRQSHNINEAII